MNTRKIQEFQIGDKINNWEIVAAYPPAKTGASTWHYDIQCCSCRQTIRKNLRPSLLKSKQLGYQCNSCATIQRNIANKQVQIGNKYGKLTVIGDAGYKIQSNGKRRHYSVVQCDCGSESFEIMDNRLQNGNTISCGCIISRGEQRIKQWLDNNNIDYAKEYSFADLLNPETKHRLRFDFCILNNNQIAGLIEFDGRQHTYGPDTDVWSRSKDSLEDIKFRDNLKNQYCQKNNIPLLRINFTEFNDIDIILNNWIYKEGRVMLNDDKR